jgi:hypothetical protein
MNQTDKIIINFNRLTKDYLVKKFGYRKDKYTS